MDVRNDEEYKDGSSMNRRRCAWTQIRWTKGYTWYGRIFFVEKFSVVMYLVLDSLDIETNGWNSGDNLTQLQLVQDSGLENSERWLIN